MNNDQPTHELSDTFTANASLLYLLLGLGFFGWLLFDTWIDAHNLPRLLGYNTDRLMTPFYHLIAYTIIGGSIGGIINGIRSALLYYSAFNHRYFWKYIAAPWMGAALALIGFALLRSAIAIFGGDAANTVADTPQNLANFGIGVLAGYGSKDVFVWLDEQVAKLFKVQKPTPEVTGEPAAVAAEKLHAENLSVGAMETTPAETTTQEGKVVEQVPEAGTMIASGESVSLVVGTDSNGKKPKSSRKSSKK